MRGESHALNCLAPLILAALELVADGSAALRVETDGSPAAEAAAAALERHVVLLSGVALPRQGAAPPLRIETSVDPGYRIEPLQAGGARIHGSDPVRAVLDLLREWGVPFEDPDAPHPKRERLAIEFGHWEPERRLEIEATEFDPSLPAQGIVFARLGDHVPRVAAVVRAAGYRVAVISDSFDDFLPPEAHFEPHPQWFALRDGERVPRGNFALTNPEARRAYLDAMDAWLESHPLVTTLGIWPEVTSVWCEESLALGAAESYALVWRAAANAHPDREFEILATGATLQPPAGHVPANVRVRFRPGRDASALQPLAGQPKIDAIARAWESRGARVVLEIDGAPESWCGMPWPCHDAVRGDALRFKAAVMKHATHELARIWRAPETRPARDSLWTEVFARAAEVASWGHPEDAALLFVDARLGMAFRIGAAERNVRSGAAREAYLAYRAILRDLEPRHAKVYRRYRERDFRRLVRERLPSGATYEVGPAEVTDTFDRLVVKTDRLILGIDRSTAIVNHVKLRHGIEWTGNLAGPEGRLFRVVALAAKGEPVLGEVSLHSPEQGVLEIALSGAIGSSGARWSSTLTLVSASGKIRQSARVSGEGGIAVGSRCAGEAFDHWVCPAYAREGRLGTGARPAFGMPPGTLIYCRQGDRGPGLALRVPRGGTARLVDDGQTTLLATSPFRSLQVEWILFSDSGELGH
jgi:hypothetical protein